MAVLCSKCTTPWVLRGTIQNEFLSSLIETKALGETGDVFWVNQNGYYQTRQRFVGKLLGKSPLPMKSLAGESGIGLLDTASTRDSLVPLRDIGLLDLIRYSFV